MSPRNKELLLLILSTLYFELGLMALGYSNFLVPLLIAAASFLLFHLALRIKAPQSDFLMLPLASFLFYTGALEIYRLNPVLAQKQLVWIMISSLLTALIVWFLKNPSQLSKYAYLWGLGGLILLSLLLLIGHESGGARLWLKFGQLSFQPAEASKLLLLIFVAAFLAEKRELLAFGYKKFGGLWLPHPKHLGPLLLTLFLSILVLVFVKDLGFSFLLMALFLVLIYAATNRPFYLITGVTLFILAALVCFYYFPHIKARVDIWLNPWPFLETKGYQLIQGFFALAGGGVTGTGLGQGWPHLIPAAPTDFIFAAIGEEMGLLGALALIIAFIGFSQRGFVLALKQERPFERYLILGLTASFSLQAFLIIGGILQLLPLTCLTLPFVSYGGSSLLANTVALGIILKVSEVNLERPHA